MRLDFYLIFPELSPTSSLLLCSVYLLVHVGYFISLYRLAMRSEEINPINSHQFYATSHR